MSEILTERPDSALRQSLVDALRAKIENTTQNFEDANIRTIVRRQADLWTDGVRAGRALSVGAGNEEDGESGVETTNVPVAHGGDYVAGKNGGGMFVRQHFTLM